MNWDDYGARNYDAASGRWMNIDALTLHHLELSERTHEIGENEDGLNSVVPGRGSTFKKGSNEKTGTTTWYDLSQEAKDDLEESTEVAETDLNIIVHEMGHQYDYDIGNMADSDVPPSSTSPTEIRAVFLENIARNLEGTKKRTLYRKVPINPELLENTPRFFPPIYFPEFRISRDLFPKNIIGRKSPSTIEEKRNNKN